MDVETDIELSAMFSATSNPTVTESIKAALVNRLGKEHSGSIMALGHTMALFLLTVYEVESRRAQQLTTIKGIFSYFYAFRDTTNGFYPVMSAILNAIFVDFTQSLRARERSELTESILEDHMEFLLVHLCHRYVVLQDLSLRYICLLLEDFPFLKTNAYCLNVLMKCLLTLKINLGPIDGMPVTLDTTEIRVLTKRLAAALHADAAAALGRAERALREGEEPAVDLDALRRDGLRGGGADHHPEVRAGVMVKA